MTSVFRCCHNCKDRHVIPKNCHIDCKRYLKEIEENEKIREVKRKERENRQAFLEVRSNSERVKNNRRKYY